MSFLGPSILLIVVGSLIIFDGWRRSRRRKKFLETKEAQRRKIRDKLRGDVIQRFRDY